MGTFSITQTIDSGTNIIAIKAIFPSGNEKTVQRSVSYTTEEF
jgi:hypothetical protein